MPPRDERDERFRGMPRDIRLDEKESERWRRPGQGSAGGGGGAAPPRGGSGGGGAAEGSAWRRGGGEQMFIFCSTILRFHITASTNSSVNLWS